MHCSASAGKTVRSQKVVSAAGGAPSLGAAFSSSPAPAFAFGGGANGHSQSPNPFQPGTFSAGGGAFGQQQSAPTGFGATATNTAGVHVLSMTSASHLSNLAVLISLPSFDLPQ